MTDLTLSTVEFCHAAGITYRQADYWSRLGVLEPVRAAKGSGSRRRFGLREIAVARFVVTLGAHSGVHLGAGGLVGDGFIAATRTIREMPDLAGIVFVDDAGRITRRIPPGEEACVAVNLDAIAHALTVPDGVAALTSA